MCIRDSQNRYSIFDRTVEENGLKRTTGILKKGLITFSPLDQGQLTDRYLNGIPEDSRIRKDGRFLKESVLTSERLDQIRRLNDLADQRGEKLADMALGWLLQHKEVTSCLLYTSLGACQKIGSVSRCISIVLMQGKIIHLIVSLVKNRILPGAKGRHFQTGASACNSLNLRIHKFHQAGSLCCNSSVLCRSFMSHLPRTVHLVSETP